MYLAIIVLPILGSIVSGLFGRKVGVKGSQVITCGSVIITTILATLAFFEVGFNNIPVSIHLFRWIDSESLNVSWGFNFDSLTVSMLLPVLIVSSLVHLYSIGYMSHDPHNQRFFSYLSLFTFMMIILVTANNLLLMFVGWEGVGICSYLLVSFWYTRIAANQSSMSAFLINRVGDCLLTIGMFTTLWSFGNIDYTTIFSLAPYINENLITIIGVCLLIGAMAKSSQIGLHVWLPQAMEGPTPVSALIHAATMVTAGVYLLMRSSPLIEYSSTVLILCLWVGAITTIFSSLIGLFQQDIKKVIAYSTMSQLGMMVIAIGLSSYNIALFHLVNHAFYKGLLFLGAGAVIHAVSDNQDFRKYGGLRPFLPLTYSVMLIASLSLVAIPFMTGFYSKDFILESAYGQFYFSSTVVYFIATIGAMFTTLYSAKVLYLTFLTNPNGPIINYKQAHEADIFMSLPLIILALFSIFFGYITKDIFIGLASGFFVDNSLYIHPSHEIMLDTEFGVPIIFKLLPLIFTVSLSIISIVFSEFLPKILILFKFSKLGYNIFGFFNQRFLIELFINSYVTGTILKLGGQTTKIIDKGSVELLGPYGLEKGLLSLSNNIGRLSTGVVTSYALYILIGLIFYVLLLYFSLYDSSLLILMLFALVIINIGDDTILNKRAYNNLEWALTSPPKPHAFVTTSLQSFSFSLKMNADNSDNTGQQEQSQLNPQGVIYCEFCQNVSIIDRTNDILSQGVLCEHCQAEFEWDRTYAREENRQLLPNMHPAIRDFVAEGLNIADYVATDSSVSDVSEEVNPGSDQGNNPYQVNGSQEDNSNSGNNDSQDVNSNNGGNDSQESNNNGGLEGVSSHNNGSGETTNDHNNGPDSGNSGSLIDDFADPSQDMPDYTDPD